MLISSLMIASSFTGYLATGEASETPQIGQAISTETALETEDDAAVVALSSSDQQSNNPKLPTNRCSSIRPCMDEHGRFELFGEYLYWKVEQDQLNYALQLKGGVSGIIEQITELSQGGATANVNINTKKICPQWKSGFRIGTGFSSKCSDWDVELFWTRLHEHSTAHIKDPKFGVFSSQIPAVTIVDIIFTSSLNMPSLLSEARSKWQFKFDTLDFQIGRSFYPGKSTSVRPFAGVKGAWVKQKQRTSYSPIIIPDANININSSVNKKNDFEAVGISAGMDSNWGMGGNFYLTSGFSFAFLYGEFDANITSTVKVPQLNDKLNAKIKFNSHRVRPTADAYVGIEWDKCLSKHFRAVIGAAYEFQYWWNQWQVPTSFELSVLDGGASPQGDLSLQGLVVHAGLSF